MKQLIKNMLCIALVLALLLATVGCGSDSSSTDNSGTSDATATEGDGVDETEEPVEVEEPEPTLAYNYLTGEHDLPLERVGKRPFAVSVNNNYIGWPQKGISKADIVLEIETEGGITRLMCIFSDVSDAGYIGPIRSLRHQFVEAMYQWNPVITHIGTSDYCNNFLRNHGISTLNGFYTESFLYFDSERNKTYGSEHCKFTSAELLPEGLESLDIDDNLDEEMAPAFNFVEEGEEVTPSGGDAASFTFDFSGYYDGTFLYNSDDGLYYKYQDGQKQVDAGNGNAQLAFDNVILLFANVYGIANTELVDVDYSAGGEGYYFSRGRYEKITWQKGDLYDDFVFNTEDGSELTLNTGKSYLAVIRNYFDDTLTFDVDVEEADA